jgi:two-component system, cell cycle response regulator DivK
MGKGEAKQMADGTAGGDRFILIVDDFTDNREMYAQYLAFRGFRVAEAADGHEALQKAMELLPDLVVMDLSLPGLDGWEATRRLKRDSRTKGIPVVALTGHALDGHSQTAKEAGCDSFLIKPCQPQELELEIRRVLGLEGSHAEPRGRKERHA